MPADDPLTPAEKEFRRLMSVPRLRARLAAELRAEWRANRARELAESAPKPAAPQPEKRRRSPSR